MACRWFASRLFQRKGNQTGFEKIFNDLTFKLVDVLGEFCGAKLGNDYFRIPIWFALILSRGINLITFLYFDFGVFCIISYLGVCRFLFHKNLILESL